MAAGATQIPSGTPSLTGFPRYLMYDVNNVCNARCPFCPQSEIARAADFRPFHLRWEHFVRTIEEAARFPLELVRFTGDGEPLLHPRIFDMLAMARRLGIKRTNLTTNGSLMTGERLDALLVAAPHVLDVSLDAHRPETYAKYRIGLDFDRTRANIDAFLKRRDPARTRLVVSMIAHPGLEDEVAEFREYWHTRADEVAIRRPHANLGAANVVTPPVPEKRWPCPHLWQRLVVDFRGHIRFCPIDWHDQSFLADVEESTLAQAWTSPRMADLRERHVAGRYAGGGVCEKCTDWASTAWGHGWIDMMQKPELAVS